MKTTAMKFIFYALILFFSTVAYAQETLGINLEGYEYPYPVAYHTLSSQQQKMKMAYMYVKADRPNGKTIILMHGKNFNGAYWGETMKALLQEGYNVFVPDQIGFGKSSKPEQALRSSTSRSLPGKPKTASRQRLSITPTFSTPGS